MAAAMRAAARRAAPDAAAAVPEEVPEEGGEEGRVEEGVVSTTKQGGSGQRGDLRLSQKPGILFCV